MPFQKYDEPIPQHVLQKFLGRGALGEVWLARGPGGVQKAVKFMRLEELGCKRGIARRADLPENVNREISGFFVRCHPNWETWEAQ